MLGPCLQSPGLSTSAYPDKEHPDNRRGNRFKVRSTASPPTRLPFLYYKSDRPSGYYPVACYLGYEKQLRRSWAPWKSAEDSVPSTEAGLHAAPWLCLSVHESYASGQRLEGDLEKSDLWEKLIYGTVG